MLYTFFLCVKVAAIIVFLPEYVIAGAVHSSVFDKYCLICHTKQPLPPSFPSPGNLQFKLTRLCEPCHAKLAHSHVVDIKPKTAISAVLPLNASGEIDCNTCHDLHNRSKKSMLLRIEPEKLCIICHKK